MKKVMIILMSILLMGCQNNTNQENLVFKEKNNVESEVSTIFSSTTLNDFYNELFVKIMSYNPQRIDDLGDLSDYGVSFQKDQLNRMDEEYLEGMTEFYKEALRYLSTFDSEDLDYKNVKWYLEIELEKLLFKNHSFFLSHIIGEHRSLYTLLLDSHIIESEQDAKDWIKRVEGSEVVIQEWIVRYNNQLELGYLMDPMSIDATLGQLRTYYKTKPEYMDLFKRYKERVELLEISEDEKIILEDQALMALTDYYVPNMAELKKTMSDSKQLSKEINGVWALPDGERYYQFALKRHTTTTMTPEEVHQLGLAEVKRIQEDMKIAFSALGYEGDLGVSLNALYGDAETFRGQDAMDQYVLIAQTIEEDLETFFYKEDLPASSPTIKTSPGGNFYVTPSIDGKRPGAYYLDLASAHFDFSINTLAFHETVPGHHLEREHELLLENIPMVRKLAFNTAYIEGWALYAEMLADEYGYNPTPAHHIGYLKSELHRAARLVVDTGIHYKKWSRDEAVDYLVDEGLLSSGYAQAEVTRYTSWPGQACSYKIGQLKLLELRNRMEEALGDAYDIRDFHHLILGEGSMPLTLIEEHVMDYIETYQ
ncbi:MAG: DUF885 domain-containing protein [Clostridiales bacterium]|nr:DUF885 domain-containing protein [Clostridiales bacterium]